MVFAVLWLAYFTQHNALQAHPGCGNDFLLFYGQVVFRVETYHSLFIRPATGGHLGCFQSSAAVNKAAMDRGALMTFHLGFQDP